MPDANPDSEATFGELLGRLIQLVRRGAPEEEAIQTAAERLASRVAGREALIEAGIENSWAVDGDPLKERLQARQVDAILVAAGAGPVELLALVRALADDQAPVPSTASIRVKLLPDQVPLNFSGPRDILPRAPVSGAARTRGRDQLTGMVDGILQELEKAISRHQWLAALHDAQAAARFVAGMPEDARRMYAIAIKRQLPLPVVEALIEQAYRSPEEQARTAEVLRLAGYPAAERMVEILRQSDTVGPRAFLIEALREMPEVEPLVISLLRAPRGIEPWLGAELAGSLGLADTIPALTALVEHPEDRVRQAAIAALARFREKAAIEGLRRALNHEDPATRVRAGQALAARGSAAIAMPLLAALETEKDAAAWEGLLGAIAGINAPEAMSALTRLALERPARFTLGRGHLRRPLAIVRALAASDTPGARHALEQIAAEADGEVQAAALEALGSDG
jgi:HEAT repeats